ncbi:MAG: hypothetical protein IJ315_08630 [Firmicutes bacterium]|nr:hypothetical protein [Bacillota bacterium]
MKKGIPGSLKAAAIIVGSVIGAGFASGQEVMRFFTSYGVKGLGSMVLSGLLFIWICYRVFAGTGKEYKTYLRTLMPRRAAVVIEGITLIFMMFSYGAMLSGSGALMEQEWGWNYFSGILLMLAGTMGVFLAGLSGLVWINTIMVPLIVGMLLWVCLSGLSRTSLPIAYLQTSPLSIPWSELPSLAFLWDGLLYTSYNLLTLIPVLCTLRAVLPSKKEKITASVAGGGILLIISFILGLASLANYDTMKGMEIPIFALLEDEQLQGLMCCLLLLAAMLTTAISDGYICIQYLQRRGMSLQISVCMIGLAGGLIGSLGFSSLVGKVYPLFGILGLGLLLAIGLHREKEQFH